MIAAIRSYFKARIAEVDASLRQVDDPIGDDDLSRVNLDCQYKILFGDNAPFYTGNSYGESISVSIEIYEKSKQVQVDAFDALYTKALLVKNCIISPLLVKTQTSFNDIEVQSVTMESLNTNDKTFKATINLTVRADFTFN
jgi:hypothetical protein